MKRLIIIVLLAAAGVYVWSCAIDYDVAVFTFHRHPDLPRTDFLAGKLGVLEPTYARSYLYVAYRHLAGLGFNSAEREQVRSYWQDRESADWDRLDVNWELRWRQARARVAGTKPPRDALPQERYSSDTRAWTLYCSDDAFRTAIGTMKDRQAHFGRSSAAFREWLIAQDTVFSNCTGRDPKIPKPASPRLPALARADRDYQIAAAYFYAGDEPEAERRFRQIATDSASPWRGIAPYLVARSIARFAEQAPSLDRAERELRTILTNPQLAPIHGISANLLRRVRQHADPEGESEALAAALMRPHAENSLRQDLWDYTSVLDRLLEWDPWNNKPGKDARPVPRRDELTDWILDFQSNDRAHSLDRWRRTHSLPWLVAALSHAQSGDTSARELIDASAAIAPDSPAFLTAAWHRNRIRINAHEYPRDELDRILSGSLPPSARNHFRSLRMVTAGDLSEFLRFAQRKPVLVTSIMDEKEVPGIWVDESFRRASATIPRFDRDSIKVLNERMPLRQWRHAIASDILPANLKQEFTLAAFARAILLSDDEAGQELEPAVIRVYPRAEQFLGAWAGDRTLEERRFTGVFALLHMASVKPYLSSGVGFVPPSHHMDSYRNNWWCPLGSKFELDWDLDDYKQRYGTEGVRSDPDAAARRIGFLKEADISEGRHEMERMASTGCAPNFLSAQILAWTKSHSDDHRLPEALALTVRTGRYGCKDEKTARFSREAWSALHRLYPKSEWSRKTPYWFD